jgi:hypothetical protein
MGESRGPKPLGGGGGFQVANSGTDFKPNPRHNSGEGDSIEFDIRGAEFRINFTNSANSLNPQNIEILNNIERAATE